MKKIILLALVFMPTSYPMVSVEKEQNDESSDNLPIKKISPLLQRINTKEKGSWPYTYTNEPYLCAVKQKKNNTNTLKNLYPSK